MDLFPATIPRRSTGPGVLHDRLDRRPGFHACAVLNWSIRAIAC